MRTRLSRESLFYNDTRAKSNLDPRTKDHKRHRGSCYPRRPMKLALNGATTMRADLATDLAAAKEAGFDYLEIWAAKLRAFLKEKPASALKDLFLQSGLSPLSINSIEHVTFRDERAYGSIKQECEELSSIAAAIGCPCIVVVPGRLPNGGATRTRSSLSR